MSNQSALHSSCWGNALDRVRAHAPLVHCITNYVTVNDCANALLACGASPIMSDEPADVEDITSICQALVLNIGTLNQTSIEAMHKAGARAVQLGHPIVIDPVGAGASALRTRTAGELLDALTVCVIRGNMSEVKALAGIASTTKGVDVNPDDVVTEENLSECAAFACEVAKKTNAVVAITGAIDIVADAASAYAVRNGVEYLERITGAGCMLTCMTAAFVAANPDDVLAAAAASVAAMGLAGQVAASRMSDGDGNGTFRMYLLDALCCMDGAQLAQGALIERVL